MRQGKEIKLHIGIYGRRNTGKSSLINALAGQEVSIVSDVAGTTTDPVTKAMEIGGIGPVVFIDTAGTDDTGTLGNKRVQKTLQSVNSADMAILVLNDNTFGYYEQQLVDIFIKENMPFFMVHTKTDMVSLDSPFKKNIEETYQTTCVGFSIKDNDTELLVQKIKQYTPERIYRDRSLVGSLVSYGDIVLLITPIDIEAPEGRLILPQVQTIRDILDNDCVAVVLKEKEVDAFLKKTGIHPRLAITDSQVLLKADASLPSHIPLTGFSILLAYHKGDFENYIKGTPAIGKLKDGDRVLLLESCTHHVSCDDIGRVKIPRWLSSFTGKQLYFDVVAGMDTLQRPITDYALIIQCGGCILTRRQIISRLKPALEAGIPITNYGMAIAYVQGVYHRAIQPFLRSNEITNDYI